MAHFFRLQNPSGLSVLRRALIVPLYACLNVFFSYTLQMNETRCQMYESFLARLGWKYERGEKNEYRRLCATFRTKVEFFECTCIIFCTFAKKPITQLHVFDV